MEQNQKRVIRSARTYSWISPMSMKPWSVIALGLILWAVISNSAFAQTLMAIISLVLLYGWSKIYSWVSLRNPGSYRGRSIEDFIVIVPVVVISGVLFGWVGFAISHALL